MLDPNTADSKRIADLKLPDSATNSFKDDNVKALTKSRKRKSIDLDDGSTHNGKIIHNGHQVTERNDASDKSFNEREDASDISFNSLLDIDSRHREPAEKSTHGSISSIIPEYDIELSIYELDELDNLLPLMQEDHHDSHLDPLQVVKTVASDDSGSLFNKNDYDSSIVPVRTNAFTSELDAGGKEHGPLESFLKASLAKIPKI